MKKICLLVFVTVIYSPLHHATMSKTTSKTHVADRLNRLQLDFINIFQQDSHLNTLIANSTVLNQYTEQCKQCTGELSSLLSSGTYTFSQIQNICIQLDSILTQLDLTNYQVIQYYQYHELHILPQINLYTSTQSIIQSIHIRTQIISTIYKFFHILYSKFTPAHSEAHNLSTLVTFAHKCAINYQYFILLIPSKPANDTQHNEYTKHAIHTLLVLQSAAVSHICHDQHISLTNFSQALHNIERETYAIANSTLSITSYLELEQTFQSRKAEIIRLCNVLAANLLSKKPDESINRYVINSLTQLILSKSLTLHQLRLLSTYAHLLAYDHSYLLPCFTSISSLIMQHQLEQLLYQTIHNISLDIHVLKTSKPTYNFLHACNIRNKYYAKLFATQNKSQQTIIYNAIDVLWLQSTEDNALVTNWTTSFYNTIEKQSIQLTLHINTYPSLSIWLLKLNDRSITDIFSNYNQTLYSAYSLYANIIAAIEYSNCLIEQFSLFNEILTYTASHTDQTPDFSAITDISLWHKIDTHISSALQNNQDILIETMLDCQDLISAILIESEPLDYILTAHYNYFLLPDTLLSQETLQLIKCIAIKLTLLSQIKQLQALIAQLNTQYKLNLPDTNLSDIASNSVQSLSVMGQSCSASCDTSNHSK